MEKTDAAATVEKAIEAAPTALPPNPDMYRKNDLERLIRKMDFSWGNGKWVKPVGRRRINIREDHHGLFADVKGSKLRGRSLISYIITGDKHEGIPLVTLASGVIDGNERPDRYTRTNGYQALDTNPAHRMMLLLQNGLTPVLPRVVETGNGGTREGKVQTADAGYRIETISEGDPDTTGNGGRESEKPADKSINGEEEANIMQVLTQPSTDLASLTNQIVRVGLELLLCEIQVGLVLVEKKTSMNRTDFKRWKRDQLPTWDRRKIDDALRCGTYITRIKRLRGGRLVATDIMRMDKKAILKLGGPDENASQKVLPFVLQKLDNGQRITEKDVKEFAGSTKKKHGAIPGPTDFAEFYALEKQIRGKSAKLRMKDLSLLVSALDSNYQGAKPDTIAILEAAVRLLNCGMRGECL